MFEYHDNSDKNHEKTVKTVDNPTAPRRSVQTCSGSSVGKYVVGQAYSFITFTITFVNG